MMSGPSGCCQMLDASSTETPPQPTRLADYRPPDFLVDTVDLDVRSRPGRHAGRRASARCAATPRRRRRRAAAARRRRTRAGRRSALDGRPLAPGDYRLEPDGALVIPDGARRLRARRRDPHRPGAQHRALRPLHLGRQFLHPMRARRLPPHHLFPRPAGRDGALHRDDARRQGALSGAAVERQPGRQRRPRRTAGIGPSGSTRTPSPPTCSRWSPAISSPSRTASRPAPAARCRWRSGCAAATRTNAAMRWLR